MISGDPRLTYLTPRIQTYNEPAIIINLPKETFIHQPKINWKRVFKQFFCWHKWGYSKHYDKRRCCKCWVKEYTGNYTFQLPSIRVLIDE